MESQTTLIWTKCRVELYSITTVHLDFALIVLPCDTELDHTLWNGRDLESLLVLRVLLEKA
jgi:hypothetical protein